MESYKGMHGKDSKEAQAHHQPGDDKAKGFKETGIKSQEGGSPGENREGDLMGSSKGGTGPQEDME